MDTCKYEDYIERSKQRCIKSKRNLTIERHNFFTRMQKPEETVDDFVTALKNLSFSCEFDLLQESLVRDMFIMGLNSSNTAIKEKLLQEDNLSLEEAVQIAKSIEASHMQDKQLQNTEDELVVYLIDAESIREFSQEFIPTIQVEYSQESKEFQQQLFSSDGKDIFTYRFFIHN